MNVLIIDIEPDRPPRPRSYHEAEGINVVSRKCNQGTTRHIFSHSRLQLT